MTYGPMPPTEHLDSDEKICEEGWAAGLDVWEQVTKAYCDYLGGDAILANAQLWSLRQAIRAEHGDEIRDAFQVALDEGLERLRSSNG